MDEAAIRHVYPIVMESLPEPFEMSGLGFDCYKTIGKIPLPDGSQGTSRPAPKSSTEVKHGEAILCRNNGFQEIDPLEIFFVKVGIARECEAFTRLRKAVTGGVESGAEKIHVKASPNAAGKGTKVREHFVMLERF